MASLTTKVVRSMCLSLLFATAALTQVNAHSHVVETEDQTDPEQLASPRPMKRIGNSGLKITATSEAQRWFNQGLNLFHDFWDFESARAFQQSIRSDRQCAMCYWGLYKALSFFHGNNKGYADAALTKAMELRFQVSERERLYIEATSAKDGRNSELLWRELVNKYPEEDQARIFLSPYLSDSESVDLLYSILKKRPNDSAANHYLIHSLEATNHAEQALNSALILPKLAPNSGHMVHMPGHIYFVLGEYQRTEQAFARSTQVDEHYMQEQHVGPDDDWNYIHNLMYAIANFMEEGLSRRNNCQ